VLRKGKYLELEEDVASGFRRQHNEDLHNLYVSLNNIWIIISRKMRWSGHVVPTKEMRVVYKILVGSPERKRPIGRPGLRWKDNIRMDLRKIEWMGVD
jgi:hypothetical protein